MGEGSGLERLEWRGDLFRSAAFMSGFRIVMLVGAGAFALAVPIALVGLRPSSRPALTSESATSVSAIRRLLR